MKTTPPKLHHLLLCALVALALGGLSGCATAAQRERGLDDNDARREAAWTGVFSALGQMIFGPADEAAADEATADD